jgi:diguanylate cyclase (GGDEF)-like protein
MGNPHEDRNGQPRPPRVCAPSPAADLLAGAFVRGRAVPPLLLTCLVLVGLVCLLVWASGPAFSFPLLFLVPVAWAAWRGGFAFGTLLGLVSVAAWLAGEVAHRPDLHPAVALLNGVIRFGAFVIASSLLARLRVSMLHEKALARTDPLTGAANGRTFYEEAYQAAARALRGGRPLTLAYLDLDNFKALNDRQGHSAGDDALRHLAHAIRHNVRVGDTLARLGGDEFALLLPDTGGAEALALLSRLHRLLTEEMARRGWPVTVSIGAATFPRPAADIDVMVGRTDDLMYAAKAGGKGRVEHRVINDPARDAGGGGGVERRAAARVLSGRLARVQVSLTEEACDDLATVRDISACGLGLHMDRKLPPGTLLTVEPFQDCGAKTLLARVVWSSAEDGGWAHGCVLSGCLSPEELRTWAAEQAAAVTASPG